MRNILALMVAVIVVILIAGLLIEFIHLPPIVGWAVGIVVGWLIGNLLGKPKKKEQIKTEEKNG